jgi:hypothetical protein
LPIVEQYARPVALAYVSQIVIPILIEITNGNRI